MEELIETFLSTNRGKTIEEVIDRVLRLDSAQTNNNMSMTVVQ